MLSHKGRPTAHIRVFGLCPRQVALFVKLVKVDPATGTGYRSKDIPVGYLHGSIIFIRSRDVTGNCPLHISGRIHLHEKVSCACQHAVVGSSEGSAPGITGVVLTRPQHTSARANLGNHHEGRTVGMVRDVFKQQDVSCDIVANSIRDPVIIRIAVSIAPKHLAASVQANDHGDIAKAIVNAGHESKASAGKADEIIAAPGSRRNGVTTGPLQVTAGVKFVKPEIVNEEDSASSIRSRHNAQVRTSRCIGECLDKGIPARHDG